MTAAVKQVVPCEFQFLVLTVGTQMLDLDALQLVDLAEIALIVKILLKLMVYIGL